MNGIEDYLRPDEHCVREGVQASKRLEAQLRVCVIEKERHCSGGGIAIPIAVVT